MLKDFLNNKKDKIEFDLISKENVTIKRSKNNLIYGLCNFLPYN